MQAPQCGLTTVRSIVAQGPRAERVRRYRCVGPLQLLVGRQPTAAVLPSRLYSTMAYTAYYTRRADSTNSSGGCPHSDGGSTPKGHLKAPRRWLFLCRVCRPLLWTSASPTCLPQSSACWASPSSPPSTSISTSPRPHSPSSPRAQWRTPCAANQTLPCHRRTAAAMVTLLSPPRASLACDRPP